MAVKQYFILIGVATAVSWIGWGVVVALLNPDTVGWIGIGLFYASLFLALLGAFTLFGFGVRTFLNKTDLVFNQLRSASRQGVLLAAVVVIVMMLQSLRLLSWWNAFLVIVIFSLIEVFIISRRRIAVLRS